MAAKLNLVGKVFGRLTVLFDTGERHQNGGVIWKCQCSCGGEARVRTDGLRSGHTISCGCVQVEYAINCKTKHGMSKVGGKVTPTFATWNAMIGRVKDDRPQAAKYYKDKGIGVCERWLWYPNFLEDMGEKPDGKTLDRIDGDKGYCKENCRWANDWQQGQHRSNAKIDPEMFSELILRRGQGWSMKELAEEYGVPHSTMRGVFNRRIPNWKKELENKT